MIAEESKMIQYGSSGKCVLWVGKQTDTRL